MGAYNDHVDYKNLQESFVSNHTGTSITELSVVLSVPVASVLLRCALFMVIKTKIQRTLWLCFIVDFICLIMPTLLSATTYSDRLPVIFMTILTVTVTSVIIYLSVNKTSVSARGLFQSIKEFPSYNVRDRLHFISYFKAYTLIGTVISILAVDFTIFPRRFCKTETYGTGLMDSGVGLFIVSNAVVSPEARNKINFNQTRFSQIFHSLLSCVPLLVIGIGRVWATKGVDYQEHVTEYGVHWNFFFTLAAVKILSTLVSCILPVRSWKILTVVLCVLYQYYLSYGGGSEYIIHGLDGKGGRNGIIDSNREGIISCIGYLILYLAGVEIGRAVFRKDRKTISDYLELFLMLLVHGALTFLSLPLISKVEPVSRRFANVSYVVWMFGVCLQLIASYLLIDLLMIFLTFLKDVNEPKEKKLKPKDNSFIEAVNYNGLLYFLLANLLTGMINISIKTILVPPFYSIVIVVTYMIVLSFISFMLYIYNIKVKFW